ncbi:MAG: gamma-glutamyltransferase [Alphaproteobacteria bacterium]
MAGGFLLNNQLTDFSFVPAIDGKPVANRVEPGKRPRSSMAPVMVFDKEGRLLLVVGSPGGARIIAYVARTLTRVLDGGMDIAAAVAAPHVATTGAVAELEQGTDAEALAERLARLGHKVAVREPPAACTASRSGYADRRRRSAPRRRGDGGLGARRHSNRSRSGERPGPEDCFSECNRLECAKKSGARFRTH